MASEHDEQVEELAKVLRAELERRGCTVEDVARLTIQGGYIRKPAPVSGPVADALVERMAEVYRQGGPWKDSLRAVAIDLGLIAASAKETAGERWADRYAVGDKQRLAQHYDAAVGPLIALAKEYVGHGASPELKAAIAMAEGGSK